MSAKVCLIDHDKVLEIKEDNSCYQKVIASSKALLTTATDKYKREFPKDFITDLMKTEKVVQVIFSKTQDFKISKLGTNISVSEIYIPLTGPYAKDHSIVFTWDPAEESLNHFINSTGTDLRKSLENCIVP